jgi:hypothetical protein
VLSRKAVTLWVALAIAASAVLVWHDALWDWKRQWDASREFAALVGDPAQYEACFAKAFKGTGCERWQIKAQPNPEYWPYPDKPPFVWPEAPKQQVYKPGMSRVEYFEALCKAEAGEFIYKTVKAEGIYMIRPRMEETEDRMRDRYGVEDPYGQGQGDDWPKRLGIPGGALVGPIAHHRLSTPAFRFLEMPSLPLPISDGDRSLYDVSLFETATSSARYRSLSANSGKRFIDYRTSMQEELRADVGFVWRGIRRVYDREMGLAGGEVAVVNLKSNEIFGIRRGFILAQKLKTGEYWWLTGDTCPSYSNFDALAQIRRRDKDVDYLMLFLPKVAIPEQKKLSD